MATLRYYALMKKGLGQYKGKDVYVAKPRLLGRISFDEFCKEVADGSTVDVADVKAVLSRLATVVTRLCARGHSVECGELGTFRPSFSSKSVLLEKDLSPQLISKPRIIFTPKPEFKTSLRSVSFELVEAPSSARGVRPSAPQTPPAGGGGSQGGGSNGGALLGA